MIKNILIFAAGAVVGAIAAYKYINYKLDKAVEEHVDYVDDEPTADEEELYSRMNELVEKYSKPEKEKEGSNVMYEDEHEPHDEPYVISPEEFGDNDEEDGWETITLTLYSCGTLADIWGTKFDIEETVGAESLNTFGQYEDDSVFVRNERLKIDYEILKDDETYEDYFAEVLD